MEETGYKLNSVTENKDNFANSPKCKDNDTESKEDYSEFDFLKSNILSRVEILEKEIKEFRKKPIMVDFSCQTERSHYDSNGDNKVQVDISTQTYLENTNATLLNINGRLEELKYYLNDKIDKLQYSVKHSVSTLSLEQIHERNSNDKIHRENGSIPSSSDVYSIDGCKVKYTPYSIVKPMESNKYRPAESTNGKPLDIRASLEKSKQLFQQEIEASIQHGRMQQQQANGYPPADKKPSAFTQYLPSSSNMITSKGIYNAYNSQYYDGRRSMYYEKHPFQISREEYARELVDEIFAYDELAHANVTGVKGKRLLDQKKIQVIKDSVLSRYPLQPSESEDIAWKLICDKINTKCRGVTRTLMKRKANNSMNGYPSDYYPMRKKGSENEYFYDMPPSMASSMYQNTPIVSPVGVWPGNEREADKARDRVFSSDPLISSRNPAEDHHAVVVSDSETNVINSESNVTHDSSKPSTDSQNNHTENPEQSEEINVSSALTRPYDNESNSNSVDDNSEDRNNVSFSQSNEDNLSSNGDEASRDDNSDVEGNDEEKSYSMEGDMNNSSTASSTVDTNTSSEGFKPYSVHKSDTSVTTYHAIQTQPSFTYPPGSLQSHTSGANTFPHDSRKFYDLSPESRKFCRQECTRGSRKELTRNLIDSMFSRATLAHSNVTGARGKSMLEPAKIAKVREMVFAQYPANNKEEEEVIWRKLTTKINTKCRGVKRFLKRKNLLDGTTLSTKDRIMRDMDGNIEKSMLRNTLGLDRLGAPSNLDKINDYQYVSMVGRHSYANERDMRDIDPNIEKNMIRSSLCVDRYGASVEKPPESQYASMAGTSSIYNGHPIRDIDGNMDKSTLRASLGLDRNVPGGSPEKFNHSPYASIPHGVPSPLPNERVLRDIDNNVEKNAHINSLERKVTSSTPERVGDYPYGNRIGGASTPIEHHTRDNDIKIEHNTHRSVFSYDRNISNSNMEKGEDTERITISGEPPTLNERSMRDSDGSVENGSMHRNSLGLDRNVSSCPSEKASESIYVSSMGVVSTDPVIRDSDGSVENNIHRSAFGYERKVTIGSPEKSMDSPHVSIFGNTSSPRERIASDTDSSLDKNIRRTAFSFDRSATNNSEKLSATQYLSMVGGVSSPRDRIPRDFEGSVEKSLYSSPVGSDRNLGNVSSEKVGESQYSSMVGRSYNM